MISQPACPFTIKLRDDLRPGLRLVSLPRETEAVAEESIAFPLTKDLTKTESCQKGDQ